MAGLLFLAALVFLSSPIISLIVLARTSRLADQSERLERSLEILLRRLQTPTAQWQPSGERSPANAARHGSREH